MKRLLLFANLVFCFVCCFTFQLDAKKKHKKHKYRHSKVQKVKVIREPGSPNPNALDSLKKAKMKEKLEYLKTHKK